MANEIVLDEINGMRSREEGIPKVVLTITDGQSDNEEETKIQAEKLKKKEFNLISVGVGYVQLSELLTLSSTPNDQYSVDDFDKITSIISEISRTACQQPAEIKEETRILLTVEKNTYKYFKYPLKPDNFSGSNETFMERFTIELNEIVGSANLFFSFEDSNPKSDQDFVQETAGADKEANFLEGNQTIAFGQMKRDNAEIMQHDDLRIVSRAVKKPKLYQVENPLGKNILFFSLKGLEANNSVQVHVYNRTVFNSQSSEDKRFSVLSLVGGVVGGVVAVVVVGVVVAKIIQKKSRKNYVH